MPLRRLPFVCALTALLGASHGPAYPPTPFDLRAKVGTPVPAMTLTTGDGTTIDTGTFRGKPTYVVLLASWCEPCKKTLPNLRADVARYGDRVRFVGVDVYESRERAQAFLAVEKLPFPVAVFTSDQLDAAIPYEAREKRGDHYRIPGDVLIDGDGVVRATWYGIYETDAGTAKDPLPDALGALGVE